jgi:hypothetical protein
MIKAIRHTSETDTRKRKREAFRKFGLKDNEKIVGMDAERREVTFFDCLRSIIRDKK